MLTRCWRVDSGIQNALEWGPCNGALNVHTVDYRTDQGNQHALLRREGTVKKELPIDGISPAVLRLREPVGPTISEQDQKEPHTKPPCGLNSTWEFRVASGHGMTEWRFTVTEAPLRSYRNVPAVAIVGNSG